MAQFLPLINRLNLSYTNTSIEGILDGGHNTLACGLSILEMINISDDIISKIKKWDQFIELWKEVFNEKSFEKIDQGFDGKEKDPESVAQLPIEIIYPTEEGYSRFEENIYFISAARNNNTALSVTTRSNHKHYYDTLKERLDSYVSEKVTWKDNEDTGHKNPIKSQEIIVLFLTLLNVKSLGVENITPEGVSMLFATEVFGGVILGSVIGFLGLKLVKYIENEHVELEVLITLSLVLLVSSVCTKYHLSAPLGVVMLGLFLNGNLDMDKIEDGVQKAMGDYVYKFWHLLDETLNAILFILIGLEVIPIFQNFAPVYLLISIIVIFIVVAIVLIYFLKTNFAEYNIEKSISACVLGEKRTAESFDIKKAKKYCEEQIRKQK